MRRIRKVDAFLLASLLTIWGACTALHVKQVVSGRLAWIGVYVTTAPSTEFPIVRGFWPGAAPAAFGALQAGDRLLAVGGIDLRGAGPFEFVARTSAAVAALRALRVPVSYERAGAAATTAIELIPVAFPWRMLPLTCTLVGCGTVVLMRRPGKRISRAFFLLAIAYGLHWTFFFGGSRWQTLAWTIVFFCSSLVMWPLVLRAALIFPADVAPADGRVPWWPWLFAIFGPISLSWIYGVPFAPDVAFRAVFIVNVAFIVTLLTVLTRNFRRAHPMGRRQLKWIVLGLYTGTVPVLLADVIAVFTPELWWLHEVAVIAEIVIPISMLIGIVHTSFLDVDQLLTSAAVDSVLSVLVLAAVLAAVPRVARAASLATDLDPHTVQLVLSVLVAAAMVPAHRVLGPLMERLFFRERHALRAGVDDLLQALSKVEGPEQLLTLVGERLDGLVRPHACVIFAPFGDAFSPVFARRTEDGDATIFLSTHHPIIGALRRRRSPLDLRQWRLTRDQSFVEAERATLERLHAAALLPIRRGDDLAAAICLGRKRSGDIYTATDLALLAAVADKVSSELLRYDTAVIMRQEREMSEALLRYVPQPVAARLSRGQSLDGGERDVSVLFVDIRGYTTYSEARSVGTVFSMINRYVEAVSAVIQRRGGTVVEFLGDGVMAVFGAPESLPDHARASVQAAHEVVATVQGLALDQPEDEAAIAVGVGIASGQAFVGNIQTSDRLVYTAIGDVVNLASRIQALTRDLRAAIAIDARTHRRAGDSAVGFNRHERMCIRGRAEPVDVYALPVGAA